ncbi:MAG: TetR/AcrR family transcriptional regulator [Alphaproteobacteria bacterium]|jgi:TetR/AcrR family transcriptional regulator, transcriptional repressor for nem operon|nr:TetR/AcrR family transcriptional regulator [Alphaproteobacteria bacterium]MBT5860752.1 TetR/AcrR family transcriptional regulator [Alphaproteobacteria bacterium]
MAQSQPPQDKRTDLTNAAQALFYEQGFGATSLANVAERAGVPLGNVYYYFKTKDSLVDAILVDRRAQFDAMAQQWELHEDPKDRLGAFLDMNEASREMVTKNGCPVGGLCMELNKDRSALGTKAADVLRRYMDWVTAQFQAMGRADADDLSARLLASIQGAMLMANTFHDPDIISRELVRVREWLDAM